VSATSVTAVLTASSQQVRSVTYGNVQYMLVLDPPPPDNGRLAMDEAGLGSTENLYFSRWDVGGTDATALLMSIREQDTIRVQDSSDVSIAHRFLVTGAPGQRGTDVVVPVQSLGDVGDIPLVPDPVDGTWVYVLLLRPETYACPPPAQYTVVPSTDFPELWADPRLVAARCDEFVYREITRWDAIIQYELDDYVYGGDDCVYRAITVSPPVGLEPADPDWVRDEQAGLEQATLETAIANASWLLWSLTNGKFHGVQCWMEDYRVIGCKLRLRRGPITFIKSVQRIHHCGEFDEDLPNWCLESATTLSFCCHPSQGVREDWQTNRMFACGCDGDRVRVTYEIAANLPPGASAEVAHLACEYGKAAAGKACSLPERVTSITRQGVSWTVLDPQDFLDKGYTGLGRLNQWLSVARRSVGGQFIDPMQGVRLFSQHGDCGGAFGDQRVSDPVPDPFDLGFQTQG
jgi:hypothetical protein